MAEIALAAVAADGALAVRRRILAVAEVVVAGQVTDRQVERVVQRARRREVGLATGAIKRDVARIDHEVRCGSPQRRADPPEILEEERLLLAEMGIGDLGDAENHGPP